jgi:hypothetical protein
MEITDKSIYIFNLILFIIIIIILSEMYYLLEYK